MIVVAIVIAGAGFFGGMQYQKSQRTLRAAGQFGGQQFANRAGQNGRPVSGSIISSDDTSVTVKLTDGSSKIVLLTGSTVVNKQTTGSKADLTTGERVLVIGKENSDGSVTADSVSLNPMFRGAEATPTPAK
ncbi:MAG: hypothetical protein HW400_486 [Candidatus Levybacteria bacterium]|nr:hypothetical protein [Candidatus Levybacteria bacterium]